MSYWSAHFGNYKLSEITAAEISKRRDQLLKEGNPFIDDPRPLSAQSVKHYLTSLRSLFNTVIKQWFWLPPGSNPLDAVNNPKIDNARERFLSKDEAHRLIEACGESNSAHLHLLVLLALTTGARKSELLGIRWENIDWQRKVVTIYNTKNTDHRQLPLIDPVPNLLLEKRDSGGVTKLGGLVFSGRDPNRPINIRKGFSTACRRVGIENFNFHDLRHSCASFLAQDGRSLLEIGLILGHRSQTSTKRYAHIAEQQQHALAEETMRKLLCGQNE